MPLFDAKELYDERYRQLMIDKELRTGKGSTSLANRHKKNAPPAPVVTQ